MIDTCFCYESRREKVPPTNYRRTDAGDRTSSALWLVSHGYRYSIDMQYLAHLFGSYADAADCHPLLACSPRWDHPSILYTYTLFSPKYSWGICFSEDNSRLLLHSGSRLNLYLSSLLCHQRLLYFPCHRRRWVSVGLLGESYVCVRSVCAVFSLPSSVKCIYRCNLIRRGVFRVLLANRSCD